MSADQYLQHTRDHLLILLAPWYISQAFGTSDNGFVLRFGGLHVCDDCEERSVEMRTKTLETEKCGLQRLILEYYPWYVRVLLYKLMSGEATPREW